MGTNFKTSLGNFTNSIKNLFCFFSPSWHFNGIINILSKAMTLSILSRNWFRYDEIYCPRLKVRFFFFNFSAFQKLLLACLHPAMFYEIKKIVRHNFLLILSMYFSIILRRKIFYYNHEDNELRIENDFAIQLIQWLHIYHKQLDL